MTVKAHETEKS